MAQFERWFTQDLSQKIETRHCETVVFSADNLSVIVGVSMYDGGEAADQTGASVVCYAIRADGNTVEFTGEVDGNKISTALPQSCFVAPGPLAIMLQSVNGTGDEAIKTTVLKAVFTVEASQTGSIVDPGHVIPDVAEIIAMLDQMEQATEDANTAAQTANSAAASAAAAAGYVAPVEATSTASRAYTAGDYLIYNGKLYAVTAAIAHGGTITPGTNCQELPDGIGGEVSDLKSAIDSLEDQIEQGEESYQKTIIPAMTPNTAINSTDGTCVTGISNVYASTDYIDIENATEIDNSFWGYSNYGFAFYTAAKAYISGGKNVMPITDIPNNAKYIRFTDYVANGEHSSKTVSITFSSQVVGGIKAIAEDVAEAIVSPVSSKVDSLENDIVYPSVLSNNLIDPEQTVSGGYYLWSSGAWVENSNFKSSGLIACSKNETLYANTAEGKPQIQVTYWKEDGITYISGADVAEGSSVFTVPNNDNIAYLRISMSVTRTKYQLNKGSLKAYDEYVEGYSFGKVVESPNIKKIEEKTALIGSKFAHFSFDDCVFWEDLTTNASSYNSAFDNAFLGSLKEIHDSLGLKFSLFCFIENNGMSIADVTNKFASEFSANKDWLRFSFHGVDVSTSFATMDATTAAGYYNTFVTAIYKMTGDYECIDRVTRLSSFGGSKEVCKALRDCDCGLRGYLCADGNYGSYYLSSDQNAFVNASCKLFDAETQLTFIHSISRLEGSITSDTLKTLAYQNHRPIYEFFTHQDQFSASVKSKMQSIGEWLNNNGFIHNYAQYVLTL